jgi:hypothetical protein
MDGFVSIKNKIQIMQRLAEIDGKVVSRFHAVQAGVYCLGEPSPEQKNGLKTHREQNQHHERSNFIPIPRKFTPQEVLSIRTRYSQLQSYREVAKEYGGCSAMTIRSVVQGTGAYKPMLSGYDRDCV